MSAHLPHFGLLGGALEGQLPLPGLSASGVLQAQVFGPRVCAPVIVCNVIEQRVFSVPQTSDTIPGTSRWQLGTANSVSPTSPNRTVTVTVNGQTVYLHAKTTND